MRRRVFPPFDNSHSHGIIPRRLRVGHRQSAISIGKVPYDTILDRHSQRAILARAGEQDSPMELQRDAEATVGYTRDSFQTPSSSDSPAVHGSSGPTITETNNPVSSRLGGGTRSSDSPAAHSRRSRRGCNTCRKRKVKCDERRPICGHCSRLNLICGYDIPSTAQSREYTPRRIQKTRDNVTPSEQRRPTGSIFEHQSSAPGTFSGLHTSRAQSVSYDASIPCSVINTEAQMSDQVVQKVSGPPAWELELLGEDSLWANLPILENFMSMEEPEPLGYVSAFNMAPSPGPVSSSNNTRLVLTAAINSETRNTIGQNGILSGTISTNFDSTDEIILLRHFVDFAVPPILVGVEPRWNSSRDALLRLSKLNLPLRHAICAFSALSLGESPGNQPFATAQSSTYYLNLAMSELETLFDEQSSSNVQIDSHESILATIFFLSYIELIVSNVPKTSLDLLNRAHILMSTKESPGSTLYQQLQNWLKLLDAKVVSAGGEGFHLHTNPETRDLEAVRESYGSSTTNDEPDITVFETEEILFNSLNRKAYDFYLEVLNFSGRIARLDKWHRARGSVQDEFEVMIAADKISRDLNALWTRRPAIIDLADKRDQLRQYLSPGLAVKVEQHLRTYTANFYACFIHLQRVAYAHLRATPQVTSAVKKIGHFTLLAAEDDHGLPVSMLWPLMMAACEADDEEMQGWIIGRIEGMEGTVGNAARTAGLVREIVKRQKSGQRADARTVMQETFGQVFAII